MKKLVINKTILIFLNINDMITLKRGDLKIMKKEYLKTYDNCVIYNYFDLKHNKNIIKDRINKLHYENQIKVNARKCEIKVIDLNFKNNFLNQNHIQGSDKSQIFYGAYFDNQLLSVITFSNKRSFNGGVDSNEYELTRFCIKGGFIIVGIFNRLLKKFIENYSPNKIISFADLNLVNKEKNIYINNGFKLTKNVPPDFRIYLKHKDNVFHKFTYGNKYYKNEKISEEEKNVIRNNSYKVWNCGKLKYELYLKENNIILGFIYQIRNKIDNKKYIGQTTRSLNKRMYEYKAALKYEKFYNSYLLNAFKKYGWGNFEFSIIDTAQTIEELNTKEIKYIVDFNTTDKKTGYNLHDGGRNAIPKIETLEKMSRSHSGIKQTKTWVDKRVAKAGSDDAKKYGRKKTDEERERLSEFSPKYWLGKKRDDETREKISKTKKERGMSSKQKEVLCKKVLKINIFTNEIMEYESTAHAAEKEGVNQSTISRRCSKESVNKGFSWAYL